MDKLEQKMDDESIIEPDDLVEYTLEEQEEEPVEGNPDSAEDSEELVEVSSNAEGAVDGEELSREPMFVKVGSSVKSTIPDVRVQENNPRKATSHDGNILEGNFKNKITILPQSSTSGGRMKLLNSTQATLPSSTATTSYRLVHADGTVVMNLTQPQTMKKLISITNTNFKPQTNSKVTFNQHGRLVQIQPQNISSSLGSVMKTVTIPKNTISIPAGAFKTLSRTSSGPTGSLPKTVMHFAKVDGSTESVVTPNINNNISSNGGNDDRQTITKLNTTIPIKKVTATTIQQRCVPGIKGVQYVRVLNQQAVSGSGATPKMIFQTVNKAPAAGALMDTVETGPASAGTSKMLIHNNRSYVVRNGIGKMATLTSTVGGKTSVLPATRKIIIGAPSTQSQDQYKKTTPARITFKKEDIELKPLRTFIMNQPQTTVNRPPAVRDVNIKAEDSGREVKLDNNMMAVEKETMRKTTAYGFPEDAYKKRPCNCTKSQCLKLYCDCFANGEFCYNCNCKDCYNTFEHDSERQKAIRCTLERNPNAFKPKIGPIGPTDDGTRLHTKGCNCKRSGCLKNYCECYEAKIPCSSNCKCVGCRNTDQFALEFSYFGTPYVSAKPSEESDLIQGTGKNNVIFSNTGDSAGSEGQVVSTSSSCGLKRNISVIDTDISELPAAKQPHNFMTMDVIEATVQCMVAQADECLKRGCSIRTSERMILEEYGRCLLEIQEFAFKTDN